MTGITKKKIIISACAVIIHYKTDNFHKKFGYQDMLIQNELTKKDNTVPNNPKKALKMIYNVPISLCFVEKHHLRKKRYFSIRIFK